VANADVTKNAVSRSASGTASCPVSQSASPYYRLRIHIPHYPHPSPDPNPNPNPNPKSYPNIKLFNEYAPIPTTQYVRQLSDVEWVAISCKTLLLY